jgi:hypothetical protein
MVFVLGDSDCDPSTYSLPRGWDHRCMLVLVCLTYLLSWSHANFLAWLAWKHDLSISASQLARTAGMSHHALLELIYFLTSHFNFNAVNF